MKSNVDRLCAIVLLTVQTTALAQKTEVSVRKGKVIAETGTARVAVEAGRKAVLAPDKNLTVAVDDPMVDDVMEIYKWVEEERQANKQRIDTTSILVYREEITPDRQPVAGETVITKVKNLTELESYDVLFQEGGVCVAAVHEPGH